MNHPLSRCVLCISSLLLLILALLQGCVKYTAQEFFGKGIVLNPYDARSGNIVPDVDVFQFTSVDASGSSLIPPGELHSRDIFYRYYGKQKPPISITSETFKTISYNFIVRVRKPPLAVYQNAIFYRRGYFTTFWGPGSSGQVRMLKIADSLMANNRTQESEIDILLDWSYLCVTEHGWNYQSSADTLYVNARQIKKFMSVAEDFNGIARFAIGEYKWLLTVNEITDENIRKRIYTKIEKLETYLE